MGSGNGEWEWGEKNRELERELETREMETGVESWREEESREEGDEYVCNDHKLEMRSYLHPACR